MPASPSNRAMGVLGLTVLGPTVLGLAIAVALVAGSGPCAAEPGFSFTATPGRLPKTVVPMRYSIDLKPDMENSSLAGSEVVDIDVREPTSHVLMNAVNMTIESAALAGEPGQTASVALDAAQQFATLTFPQALSVGPHRLRIAFKGQITKFGRGLFYVDYPTNQGSKRMISSQLEPAEARRIFPCWDEPVFKATFELAVTVPERFLAVSNMPAVREEPAGSAMKRVSFAATPKMSSYLFVLVAGELERVTGQADGTEIGVVTTAGKTAQGRYALDSAIKLLTYYNDYFGVKYPLPKLDLIAVPGGFGGAMENWGGITFFESRLLFDPAVSPPDARRGIFIIIAHEMAHLWFGDLVTMAWWDNLWLNEGFASWMQAKAAQLFNPAWDVWLNGNDAKQWAMNEDARSTSHPIQQPIANETEAMAVFDSITYSKGQAFIRMLESYLGEDVFRAGIRDYMKTHAYSNTTTTDLWRALEAASGRPVAAIAAAFTEQEGVPLILSEVTCTGDQQRIVLRQGRFTLNDPDAKPTHWPVPVAVGPASSRAPSEIVLVQDGAGEVIVGRCDQPLKANLGDVGYYRVQYDAVTQARLAKSFGQMSPADRVNLLADSWALVEAGRIAAGDFFALVDEIGDDDTRAVWEQTIRILQRLDYLQRNRPERVVFRAYARATLRPIFNKLGWDPVAGERADRGLLRIRLIRMLGDLDDQDILAEARRRFATFLQTPQSLRPGLRDAVTHLVGRHADQAAYEALLALARKSTNTTERVRYYFAIAGALDPALARETLNLALTDELPTNLVGAVISSVASAGEQPELAWEFVRANFAALETKQGPLFRTYFASNLMTSFSDPARATELANFAPVHETSGGRMVAARARATIMADADFRARRLAAVDGWIEHRVGRP